METNKNNQAVTIVATGGCKPISPRRESIKKDAEFILYNGVDPEFKCTLDDFTTAIENYDEWKSSRQGMQAILDAQKPEETGVSINEVKHGDVVVGYTITRKFKKLGEVALSTVYSATKFKEALGSYDEAVVNCGPSTDDVDWLKRIFSEAPQRKDGRIVIKALADSITWYPNKSRFPDWSVRVVPFAFVGDAE